MGINFNDLYDYCVDFAKVNGYNFLFGKDELEQIVAGVKCNFFSISSIRRPLTENTIHIDFYVHNKRDCYITLKNTFGDCTRTITISRQSENKPLEFFMEEEREEGVYTLTLNNDFNRREVDDKTYFIGKVKPFSLGFITKEVLEDYFREDSEHFVGVEFKEKVSTGEARRPYFNGDFIHPKVIEDKETDFLLFFNRIYGEIGLKEFYRQEQAKLDDSSRIAEISQTIATLTAEAEARNEARIVASKAKARVLVPGQAA